MKKHSLWGLALALLMLAAARAAPAAQATAVAQAAGDANPVVVTWADDANGNSKIDGQRSGQMHDMFAGVTYVVTDQKQLLLEINGSSSNLLISPVNALDESGGKAGDIYYIVHVRTKSSFLDGIVYNFTGDPSHGLAKLTLLQALDNQGNTATSWIEQKLTWSTPGTSPTPSPTPNPLGIGGF